MNDRQLLDVLAAPEPDYHDDPDGWQRWRDKTTEALRVVRGHGPPSELEPSFTVRVFLDGDDYPPTATENVLAALDAAVVTMKGDGLIVAGSVIPGA